MMSTTDSVTLTTGSLETGAVSPTRDHASGREGVTPRGQGVESVFALCSAVFMSGYSVQEN